MRDIGQHGFGHPRFRIPAPKTFREKFVERRLRQREPLRKRQFAARRRADCCTGFVAVHRAPTLPHSPADVNPLLAPTTQPWLQPKKAPRRFLISVRTKRVGSYALHRHSMNSPWVTALPTGYFPPKKSVVTPMVLDILPMI